MATHLAEDVRQSVADFDWSSIDPTIRRVTVSIGVGTSDGEQGAEQDAADRALYRAKASGRNKVEIEIATSSRLSA